MKNLNELAAETFEKLMALPDEEFFAYFSQFKPSDLGPTLEHSGMFEAAQQEAEIVYKQEDKK